MAKHHVRKFKVDKVGDTFQVVIIDSGRRVPGTPNYENKKLAQEHVDQLNQGR